MFYKVVNLKEDFSLDEYETYYRVCMTTPIYDGDKKVCTVRLEYIENDDEDDYYNISKKDGDIGDYLHINTIKVTQSVSEKPMFYYLMREARKIAKSLNITTKYFNKHKTSGNMLHAIFTKESLKSNGKLGVSYLASYTVCDDGKKDESDPIVYLLTEDDDLVKVFQKGGLKLIPDQTKLVDMTDPFSFVGELQIPPKTDSKKQTTSDENTNS